MNVHAPVISEERLAELIDVQGMCLAEMERSPVPDGERVLAAYRDTLSCLQRLQAIRAECSIEPVAGLEIAQHIGKEVARRTFEKAGGEFDIRIAPQSLAPIIASAILLAFEMKKREGR